VVVAGKASLVAEMPEGGARLRFYNLGGGSFGLQIGAEKTDFILLIMNDDGVKGLLRTSLSLVERPVSRWTRRRTAARQPMLDSRLEFFLTPEVEEHSSYIVEGQLYHT